MSADGYPSTTPDIDFYSFILFQINTRIEKIKLANDTRSIDQIDTFCHILARQNALNVL